MNTIIISVCASLFGIFIGIMFQKYMNDRDKKFAAYLDFMEAVADSTSAEHKKDAIRRYRFAKQKIIFYGSDDVINHLSEIPNFKATNLDERNVYLDLIAKMRKETSVFPWGKRISKDTLIQLLGL